MTVNLGAYMIEMQIYTLLKKLDSRGGGGEEANIFFLLFKKKPSLRKQTLSLDGAYNLFRYINYVP